MEIDIANNRFDNQKIIAVDFDRTISEYHGNKNPDAPLGKPLKPMVDRVKKFLADGHKVFIFTARVAPHPNLKNFDVEKITKKIQDWCLEHIGERLPVTCIKFPFFDEIYDDKAISIVPNTGKTEEEYRKQSDIDVF